VAKSKKHRARANAETVREHEPEAEAGAPAVNGTSANGHAEPSLNAGGGADAEPSLPPRSEAEPEPEPEPGAEAKSPPPSPAEPAGPTPMERAGHGVVSAIGDLWSRRGVEATIGGVLALAAAIWLGGGSALTVPLVVLGLVLLLVGILGRRLRGRVALEWGPGGASFDFTAAIAPPGRTVVPDAPSRAAAALPAPDADEPEDAEVVESTGETIEMDVGALRALLAARDAADAESPKR
jgi:hypothetical protein